MYVKNWKYWKLRSMGSSCGKMIGFWKYSIQTVCKNYILTAWNHVCFLRIVVNVWKISWKWWKKICLRFNISIWLWIQMQTFIKFYKKTSTKFVKKLLLKRKSRLKLEVSNLEPDLYLSKLNRYVKKLPQNFFLLNLTPEPFWVSRNFSVFVRIYVSKIQNKCFHKSHQNLHVETIIWAVDSSLKNPRIIWLQGLRVNPLFNWLLKLCDFAASCKISLELLFGTTRSFVGLMWNPKIGQQTTPLRPGSNDCLLRSRINTLQKQGRGSGYMVEYFYTSPALVEWVGLFSTLIEALDASLEALNRSNMNLEYCHILS